MSLSRMICLIVGCLLMLCAKTGQAEFWSSKSPTPGKIALMLPLQGAYGASAQALRDGFLAAYYQSLPQDAAAPTIRIIDTSGGDIVALYCQAVDQGVNLVVGPLSKEDGFKIVQAGALPVPTLMLNTIALPEPVPNLYQLSLAPEDEVKQGVAKAWRDGRRNALVIAPAGLWGQRLSQVFLSGWQALGGKVIGVMYYQDPRDFATQVSQALQIEASETRSKDLRRLLNQPKLRTIPYRRQDLDMVFMVAKPENGRQLRPLLNFYYAGNIPIYATSHIYAGLTDPQNDQDINKVLFCAIPWEIAPQTLPADLQAIRQSVAQAWPLESQHQPQFFALGADSYRLTRQIRAGAIEPEINGATGKLTLQPNRVWTRQLPWAQVVQGQPQLIQSLP